MVCRSSHFNDIHLNFQIKEKAIPIFNAIHPGCVAVFAFDNSSGHSVFAADALLAHKMNLGPGGKQPIMRPGMFNGQPQSMVFPDDHPDVARQKV